MNRNLLFFATALLVFMIVASALNGEKRTPQLNIRPTPTPTPIATSSAKLYTQEEVDEIMRGEYDEGFASRSVLSMFGLF